VPSHSSTKNGNSDITSETRAYAEWSLARAISFARAHPRQAILAIATFVFVLQAISFHTLRVDDAYITYRYGQNLVLGNGLVFNPGERLLGSTAAGHVLMSALGYAIVGHGFLPALMSILGCLGWTMQAVGVFLLLERAVGQTGAALVALCVAAGSTQAGIWVPMETNLVSAFVLWSLVLARRDQWKAAAVMGGLAALTRPDAYLFAILLGPLCIHRLRVRALAPVGVFLGVVGPWLLFSTFYFGSPLPQPARAKFQRSTLSQYADTIFDHLPSVLTGREPFAETATDFAAVMCWLAFLGAAWLLLRRDRLLWPLLAWGVGHAVAYLYLRPFTMHTWHIYPCVLVFSVVTLGGLGRLALDRPELGALPHLVLAAFIGIHMHATARQASTHKTAFWYGARDKAYQAVSAYLAENAKPDHRVMTLEAGTVGYYSGLPIVDSGALITRNPSWETPGLRWYVQDPASQPLSFEPSKVFQDTAFHVRLYDLQNRKP
jgi:hypothetical protein